MNILITGEEPPNAKSLLVTDSISDSFTLVLLPHLVQHPAAQHSYNCHLCIHPSVDEVDGDLHVLGPILELLGHVCHTSCPKKAPNHGRALVCCLLSFLPAVNPSLEELVVHL